MVARRNFNGFYRCKVPCNLMVLAAAIIAFKQLLARGCGFVSNRVCGVVGISVPSVFVSYCMW
jgi:hypothetical protein